MIPARATAHLEGAPGEEDLRPGSVVMVDADHPWLGSTYLIPLETALAERPKDDLIETAKALGITGTSGMNKDELVAAIEEESATSAPAPVAE